MNIRICLRNKSKHIEKKFNNIENDTYKTTL